MTPRRPTPVVIPGIPGSLLTLAASGLSELQSTASVKSWRLPSEKVPIATSPNCVWFAKLIPGGGGNGSSGGQFASGLLTVAAQISILASAAGFTTTEPAPATGVPVTGLRKLALMLVWPGPLALVNPNGLTVVIASSDDPQVASRLKSTCEPSV